MRGRDRHSGQRGSGGGGAPKVPAREHLLSKGVGACLDSRYVPAVVDRPSRFVRFESTAVRAGIDTLPDDPEHDYFLNRLATSSLFGVMPLGDELAGPRHQTLAVVMSVLLLAMVAIA